MEPGATEPTPSRGLQAVGVALTVLLLVGAAVVIVMAMGGGQPSRNDGWQATPTSGDADYEVVIPPGAAALAANGQEIEFFPPGFTMRVGETLRIRNTDVGAATLGPFTVGPGETLTRTFTEPGVIEGYCSFTDDARSFFEVVPA